MSGLWDAAQLWPCVNVTESCDFCKRSLVGPTQTVQKLTGSIWRYELFSIWPFLVSAVGLFHINGPCLQCLYLYTLSGVEAGSTSLPFASCRICQSSLPSVRHQHEHSEPHSLTTHHCPSYLETPCCTTVSGFDRAPHMYGVSKRLDFLGSGVGLYDSLDQIKFYFFIHPQVIL